MIGKRIILLFVCFAAALPGNAMGDGVFYRLTLQINGEPVSNDEFFDRKPTDEEFPEVVDISFESDVIDLIIEFQTPAELVHENDSFTCNFSLQTESGGERFNYHKDTGSLLVASALSGNGRTYRCEFVNLTQHAVGANLRSPIEKNRIYLFEILVNELENISTYFQVRATEHSEWPNKATQSGKGASKLGDE